MQVQWKDHATWELGDSSHILPTSCSVRPSSRWWGSELRVSEADCRCPELGPGSDDFPWLVFSRGKNSGETLGFVQVPVKDNQKFISKGRYTPRCGVDQSQQGKRHLLCMETFTFRGRIASPFSLFLSCWGVQSSLMVLKVFSVNFLFMICLRSSLKWSW